MFWCGRGRGVCPAGGQHDPAGSGRYALRFADDGARDVWRWCQRCEGLFFPGDGSHCPADGPHDGSASAAYAPTRDGIGPEEQGGWQRCGKCRGLVHESAAGACPADGGGHADAGVRLAVSINALGPVDPNRGWTNWDRTQTANVVNRYRPTNLDQLASIVEAAAATGGTVRAVGSSWSFSDVARTEGSLVETHGLNQLLDPAMPSVRAEDPHLVHVEAGIRIRDLYLALDGHGLALPTMGGSGGQTLAGVISTGTHGGDFDLAPIADMVRAIQLVAPDGRVYWIEHPQRRATAGGAAEIQARFPYLERDAIKLDDESWFRAALVSVGSLGIVYSYVLAARPSYRLVQVVSQAPWSTVRARLASGELFRELPAQRFVEVICAPDVSVDDPGGDRSCIVVQRREAHPHEPNTPGGGSGANILGMLMTIENWSPFLALASGLFAMIPVAGVVPSVELATGSVPAPTFQDALTRFFNALNRFGMKTYLPRLNRMLLSMGRTPGTTTIGPSFAVMDTYDYSTPTINVDSIEIFFPATTDGTDATFVATLEAMFGAIASTGDAHGGYVALRWTRGSDAYLAMQQAPVNCSAEVAVIKGLDGNPELIERLQRFALDHGARLHWGQRNELLEAHAVAAAYPELDAWRRVRAALTADGRWNAFDSDFTRRCGLSAAPLPSVRNAWRWCSRCNGMWYAGHASPGRCADNLGHVGDSGAYVFAADQSVPGSEGNWRWCAGCEQLVFGAGAAGACFGGGTHRLGPAYRVPIEPGQPGWRWCVGCESLVYGDGGACFAGVAHDTSRSAPYCVVLTGHGAAGDAGWLHCKACNALVSGTGGECPAGPSPARHVFQGSPAFTALAGGGLGQAGWRRCRRCTGLVHGRGRCRGGAPHDLDAMELAVLAVQTGWMRCKHCQVLVYATGSGRCAGHTWGHQFTNSAGYSVLIDV